MARQLRVEYPGAVYHVMSRANRGEMIFTKDGQRKAWLKCLGEVCERTGWMIHAYVLMGNHYHLLVETPEANLCDGMRWFQGTFTNRYNRYNRFNREIGHLYQGRYKSLIVDSDSPGYFRQVSSYIHLNPARARLVKEPSQSLSSYSWSSYPYYMMPKRKRPAWLRCDKVLGSEGNLKDTASGRREFETGMEGRFMEILEGVEDDELKEKWKNIRRGWYLGDQQFRKFLEKLVEAAASESRRDGFAGDGILFHDQVAARKKCRQALKALNLTLGELRETPKNDERKQVIAWYLRSKTVIDRASVSEMLCMGHPSTVSRAVTLVNQSNSKAIREMKKLLVVEK
jgi:REP element-mobilizing transposase RayT